MFQRKKRLPGLAPERSLITSKPFEDVVVQVGETQEALRDIEPSLGHMSFRPRCGFGDSFAIDGIGAATSIIQGLDNIRGPTDPQCCQGCAVMRGCLWWARPLLAQDFALDL